jgi:hypothetical protein
VNTTKSRQVSSPYLRLLTPVASWVPGALPHWRTDERRGILAREQLLADLSQRFDRQPDLIFSVVCGDREAQSAAVYGVMSLHALMTAPKGIRCILKSFCLERLGAVPPLFTELPRKVIPGTWASGIPLSRKLNVYSVHSPVIFYAYSSF